VDFDLLLEVSVTVACNSLSPSTGDHFIHMWCHLQTGILYHIEMARESTFAAHPAQSYQETAPGPFCLNIKFCSGPDHGPDYFNLKSKVTTLKFSVHCPLDGKTM